MSEASIGVIFPDEGAYAYELIDEGIVNEWLTRHGFDGVRYLLVRTPGGKASSIEACANLADEERLSRAADELARGGCNAAVWACTSASFFKGLEYSRYQAAMLAKRLEGKASSTSLAFLAALERLGASSVDIMMAYMPEVSTRFLEFFEEAGIGIGQVKDIECAPTQRTFDLDYHQELSDFVGTLGAGSNPIVIPSTSLNSLYRIEEFEDIARRPVLTANQVTMWHALELSGMGEKRRGIGRLFQA